MGLHISQLDNYQNLSKFYSRIFISRVLVIGLNFLTTAFLINNLGDKDYGIYVTLFSLINWVFILDLGIGKGMRNILTESIEKKKYEKARTIISTTFFITIILSLLFLSIYLLINNNFNFEYFFNLNPDSNFKSALSIFISIIVLKLIFGNLDQVLYSFQLSYVTVYNSFLIAVLFYSLVVIADLIDFKLNLFNVSIFYFFSVFLSYITFFIWFFCTNNKFIPSVKKIDFSLIKYLFGSGLKIFVIQILFFFMLSLDRFIILKYFDGETVTLYDIIYRVMTLLLFPFSIIAQPLWSSYAAAKANENYQWIIKIINRLYLFSLFIILGIGVLTLSFNVITEIWIGKVYDIDITIKLLIGFLLFNIMWSTIHSDILYGISNYKFMFISILIGLILKATLLTFLISANLLSINNLVITSLLGYSFFSVLSPFYIRKKIKSLYENIYKN